MTEENKDLKGEETKEETTPSGDGQPVNKEETNEELEKLKEENVRLTADNTNYKKALTKKSTEDFSLEDEPEPSDDTNHYKPIKKEDDDKAWQEVDRRIKEGIQQIQPTQNRAEIKKAEKLAIDSVIAENPEIDGTYLAGIKEYYVNRHGKTVEGLKADLNDALALYKVKNNIPLQAEEETPKGDVNVPQTPTGGGSGEIAPKQGDLNDSDLSVKEQYQRDTGMELSDETFAKYKEEVLSGKRGAPQEVINLFKSGQ